MDGSLIAPIYLFLIMLNRFNALEFVAYTKKHPSDFIQYCEILVDPNGAVILCRPSHIETTIEYIMTLKGIEREEVVKEAPMLYSPLHFFIDKYGLIAVWYSMCIYSEYKGINQFQRRTLDMLKRNGLIDLDSYEGSTNEYRLYLDRENIEEVEDDDYSQFNTSTGPTNAGYCNL